MHHFSYHEGVLHCEGVSLSALAESHGTPLYVYSQSTIEDHWRRLDQALASVEHLVCYATKANSNLAVLGTLAKLGSGFDIVSGGELQRVLRAGGRADRCTFAGVGKTADEIAMALEAGIYCFNIESAAELEAIHRVATSRGVKAPVALRVNPNVDASTHHKITTGTYENKFGIAFEEVSALYDHAASLSGLWLRGVQMHIGSQITEVTPFVRAVEKIVPLAIHLKQKHGIEFLDVGGGLGIVYQPALASGAAPWWNQPKRPLTPSDYAEAILPMVKGTGLRLLVEPGRFIVGNAGILLAEVLYVKTVGTKRFVIVDAAMNDLIRPALYEAYHEVVPLRLPSEIEAPTVPTDVVGPVCESGDVFCKDRPLPLLHSGEQIALMSAGAYGFTMASNYNSRPRPAEILVSGSNARVVRARETFEDLVRGESL
jgi:diaminopimelate decarboxylase